MLLCILGGRLNGVNIVQGNDDLQGMSSRVCVYSILESPPKTSYDEIAVSLWERQSPKRITKQRRCLGMMLSS